MSPTVFIAFGAVWLLVFVFVLVLCAAAARADERMARERAANRDEAAA